MLLICFVGCAHDPVKTYESCIVTDVKENRVGDLVDSWTAVCDDNRFVVFSRVIQKGDVVYYSSYTENSDTTERGYIKSIEDGSR